MSDSLARQKQAAARGALDWLRPRLDRNTVLGIGTGTTTNCFIELLAAEKHKFDGVVASSDASAKRLAALDIRVHDLNSVGRLGFYIDGADEIDPEGRMIKGGGGAHTGEKILATVAECFLCLVDAGKPVARLGRTPIPVEVIPAARSLVARSLVELGGEPSYRSGAATDNGNVILDVYGLPTDAPDELEDALGRITGVVESGLFSRRRADLVWVGRKEGVELLRPPRNGRNAVAVREAGVGTGFKLALSGWFRQRQKTRGRATEVSPAACRDSARLSDQTPA